MARLEYTHRLTSDFGTKRTCRTDLTMCADGGRADFALGRVEV